MAKPKQVTTNLYPEKPVEKVIHENQVYAIIIRRNLPFSGYNFVSDPQDSLQVGVNHYSADTKIKAHYHLPVTRALKDTLEVLHIDSGKCLLTLYDQNQKPFYEVLLQAGDTTVLMNGGHGLKVMENTRIIEVKQGPYLGATKDKVFFEG